MKQRIIIVLLFCLSGAAYANPMVMFDPLHKAVYAMAVVTALTAEAGLVSLLLVFWGIDLKQAYAALRVGNLFLYCAAFLPLLALLANTWFAEAIIVGLDGLLIKTLTLHKAFREENFRPLKWEYAFLIALAGNLISYFIGAVTNV
jgi:hypothetical protein